MIKVQKVWTFLSLAFMVVGILVVFDICKCVLLTFFSFTALYARSTLSPNLLSMVMLFYCNISGFCYGPISWFLQITLSCLTLLN